MNEDNGVWRTVGGRRIFIKEGQNLANAMKESGKFPQTLNKVMEINKKLKELNHQFHRENITDEEKEKLSNQIQDLTSKKKELYSEEKIKENEMEDNPNKITDQNNNKLKISDSQYNKDAEDIVHKLIENKNEMNQITQEDINYEIDDSNTNQQIKKYINNSDAINSEEEEKIYEEYNEKISNKIYDELSKNGYEYRNVDGKGIYDTYNQNQKAYNDMLKYFDKNKINYDVSRSTKAGELPSVYVKDEDGNEFRIANHYNHQSDEKQALYNRKYTAEEYINWKDTILKDIKKALVLNLK